MPTVRFVRELAHRIQLLDKLHEIENLRVVSELMLPA